jgi:hypothetical protein
MGEAKRIIIKVQGTTIGILPQADGDFISLTDMVKNFDGTTALIEQWLRNKDTILFLGIWERINNPNFNSLEFEGIRNNAGRNSFFLSIRKWIDLTRAKGLIASAGRYGGTYAHKDIAFEFGSWLSPEFKLYLIKEFQRLKDDESERLKLDWNLQRVLSKINYRIHTDAVRDVCDGTPLRRGTPAEGLAAEGHLRRDTCGGTPSEGLAARGTLAAAIARHRAHSAA